MNRAPAGFSPSLPGNTSALEVRAARLLAQRPPPRTLRHRRACSTPGARRAFPSARVAPYVSDVPRAPLPIQEFDELALLIRAHHPLICIDAQESERVEVLLEYLCGQFGMPYFEWTPSGGLRRHGQPGAVYATRDLLAALSHVHASRLVALYHFNLAGASLRDERVVSMLLEIAEDLRRHPGAVVLSFADELPEALRPAFASVELSPPTREEYYAYVRAILADVRARQHVAQRLDSEQVRELLAHLQGLTLMEVRRLLTQSLVEYQALDERAIARIAEAKGKSVARNTVLQYFPAALGFEGLAGMARLKTWIDKRTALFREPERAAEFGLTPVRGILLLGVQGCGKSHAAHAVAAGWKLPMLRLDAGRLYDKYVGATENNLHQALATAERLAPVVLWVDEIEKALASGADADGGVSQRVLGTFLTWLQEKRGNVFVVATANDVSRLPPELIRKGRFDEIFFVDLPSPQVREAILSLHLAQRGRDPSGFDLPRLAAAADGFSGSELAQAITSALFTAFNQDSALTTELIEQEIWSTRPLSVTMREPVQALRRWAQGRTVLAD